MEYDFDAPAHIFYLLFLFRRIILSIVFRRSKFRWCYSPGRIEIVFYLLQDDYIYACCLYLESSRWMHTCEESRPSCHLHQGDVAPRNPHFDLASCEKLHLGMQGVHRGQLFFGVVTQTPWTKSSGVPFRKGQCFQGVKTKGRSSSWEQTDKSCFFHHISTGCWDLMRVG